MSFRLRKILPRILIFIAIGFSTHALAKSSAKIWVNGVENGSLDPLLPSVIEIQAISDSTGEPIKDFVDAHKKFMHLVVMRSDLSVFKHIHPTFDPATGLFQVTVHLPVLNSDNQDVPTAFPKAGEYFLFAEAKSKALGPLEFRFPVTVTGGDVLPTALEPQTAEEGFFNLHLNASGQVTSEEQASLRAQMSLTRTAGEGGELFLFSVELQQKAGDGSYSPVEELQKWLMMGGHAIITSNKNVNGVEDMVFGHLHSRLPDEGATVEFSYFNRQSIVAGDIVRLWAQIKYDGQVFTLPYTVQL